MAEEFAKRTATGKGRLVNVGERSLEERRYYLILARGEFA